MGKLFDDLKANNIGQSVYYYGVENLATGWEIKEIVDNISFFDAFYDEHTIRKIEDLDKYIVYLYTVKFSQMGEMIPRLLQDEHKEIISEAGILAPVLKGTPPVRYTPALIGLNLWPQVSLKRILCHLRNMAGLSFFMASASTVLTHRK